MVLTVYGTEWPILCWCAVKKLLTHSLPDVVSVDEVGGDNRPSVDQRRIFAGQRHWPLLDEALQQGSGQLIVRHIFVADVGLDAGVRRRVDVGLFVPCATTHSW